MYWAISKYALNIICFYGFIIRNLIVEVFKFRLDILKMFSACKTDEQEEFKDSHKWYFRLWIPKWAFALLPFSKFTFISILYM